MRGGMIFAAHTEKKKTKLAAALLPLFGGVDRSSGGVVQEAAMQNI